MDDNFLKVVASIKNVAVKTVSFDVFDTLISRRVSRPKDVFSMLQSRIISEFKDSRYLMFADLREHIEYTLRRATNFQAEIRLNDIYKRLSGIYDWPNNYLAKLMDFELEIERDVVYPLEQGRLLVNLSRENGKKVIFTSDTYLPGQFIRNTLRGFDIAKENDRYFISSEHLVMKSTGELFEIVKDHCDCTGHSILHIGDNLESDVLNAGLRSLRSEQFIRFESRFKLEACKRASTSPVSLALAGGISQELVDKLWNIDLALSHPEIIRRTTLSLSAPLILAFCIWTIRKCKLKKVKHLYCLARDGFIPFNILRLLSTKYKEFSDISISYLYASRQALLSPSITEISDKELEWILAPTQLLTLRMILDRVDVAIDRVKDAIAEHELENYIDNHIPPSQRHRLAPFVSDITKEILFASRKNRETTLGYFTQEGLFDTDVKKAVLDVGWGGSMQYAISKMLDESGYYSKLNGFYFGLRGPTKSYKDDELSGWFISPNSPRTLDQRVYIVPMIELFFAADHGGCTGYAKNEDGRYLPKLRKGYNSALEWGVISQHKAMMDYVDLLVSKLTYEQICDLPEATIDELELALSGFLLNPSREEAEVYCSFQDAEDQSESFYHTLGKPYTFEELLLFYTNDFMHHHNEWRQGSLAITDSYTVKKALSHLKSREI